MITRHASHAVAYPFAITALIIFLGCPARTVHANASTTSDTRNWFFFKDANVDFGSKTYWNPANALTATYSQKAQAWNEGGTSGLLTAGPNNKFQNNAGTPVGITWPELKAKVPTPGTTAADGNAYGNSEVQAGTLWGTNYVAYSTALAGCTTSTIPPGGFGKGYAEVDDPWQVDIPQPRNNDEDVEMHSFLDLSGSSFTYDTTGGGSAEYITSIDGASEYTSDLFDYSVANGTTGFSSTLNVAPGIQLYLNDNSGSLEFNPADAVTTSQLKAYLDGFQTGTGWDLGSTQVLIGMDVPIANSDAGTGTASDGGRLFTIHDDVSAEADDAAPLPEPAAATLFVGSLLMLRRPRQRRCKCLTPPSPPSPAAPPV
jgi:hypothetical protein